MKTFFYGSLVLLASFFFCGCRSAEPVADEKKDASSLEVIRLQKSPEKDFVILNLSDPQLNGKEWRPGNAERRILVNTLEQLIARVKPDLITITGDLAWAGDVKAYDAFASYLDSFGIPWAPIMGNHDNQKGYKAVKALADRYAQHPLCLFKAGDPRLGCGNYIIAIEQDNQIISALFMMDSHDRVPAPTPEHPDGMNYAKLWSEQLDWYRAGVDLVNKHGCRNSAILLHIPIYAYREAVASAYRAGLDMKNLTFAKSQSAECWNPGFEGAVGFVHEGISSFPNDDGVFQVIQEKGSTTHVICGHDHINNFIIPWHGVKLVYSVKAGAGCYWEPENNGGTVLVIGNNGIQEVRQEFVNVK